MWTLFTRANLGIVLVTPPEKHGDFMNECPLNRAFLLRDARPKADLKREALNGEKEVKRSHRNVPYHMSLRVNGSERSNLLVGEAS
jgi:hypothetical protein